MRLRIGDEQDGGEDVAELDLEEDPDRAGTLQHGHFLNVRGDVGKGGQKQDHVVAYVFP